MSILDIVANLTFMCLVNFTGKRKLYLTMVFGIVISSLVVTTYGFIYLPHGYNSFDQRKHTTFRSECKDLTYIPMIFLYLWSFFSFCGFNGMPWILLSEMFPFKYVFCDNLTFLTTKFSFFQISWHSKWYCSCMLLFFGIYRKENLLQFGSDFVFARHFIILLYCISHWIDFKLFYFT